MKKIYILSFRFPRNFAAILFFPFFFFHLKFSFRSISQFRNLKKLQGLHKKYHACLDYFSSLSHGQQIVLHRRVSIEVCGRFVSLQPCELGNELYEIAMRLA